MRVLRRWVRLCCRRIEYDARLVEIGGVPVNPFSSALSRLTATDEGK